ncbi:thioredoxin fold domain-containing protein [Azohydromonas lata]|uniref:thioredoxin fold domain-containing protein n=1 Tax=Azohydromonas lata TaxID=45677 RepID=UPI000A00CF85|nr:thioredoxin fold domain-containing protein [Azohydromonas lata]
MNRRIQAIGLLVGGLAVGSALADGRSAVHNLFSNLARSNANLGVTETSAVASPTLVRGIYRMTNQQGVFVGYINESGTLFGDYRGLNVVPNNGARLRALTATESAEVRAEVLAAIEYEKLPKLTYGDGGNRRLLIFSAVDCPSCKVFEDGMRKYGANLNSTFYVVPASLQPIAQGGGKAWQTVSRIWCASDAGAAWKSFWSTRSVPQARQCQFTEPSVAESADQQLKEILRSVGIQVNGTPQIVLEDGSFIADVPNLSPAYVAATFGSFGARQQVTGSVRWLSMSAEDQRAGSSGGGFDLKKAIFGR